MTLSQDMSAFIRRIDELEREVKSLRFANGILRKLLANRPTSSEEAKELIDKEEQGD